MVVKGKKTVEFEGESTNNKCSTVSQLPSNTDHQVLGLVVGEELPNTYPVPFIRTSFNPPSNFQNR